MANWAETGGMDEARAEANAFVRSWTKDLDAEYDEYCRVRKECADAGMPLPPPLPPPEQPSEIVTWKIEAEKAKIPILGRAHPIVFSEAQWQALPDHEETFPDPLDMARWVSSTRLPFDTIWLTTEGLTECRHLWESKRADDKDGQVAIAGWLVHQDGLDRVSFTTYYRIRDREPGGEWGSWSNPRWVVSVRISPDQAIWLNAPPDWTAEELDYAWATDLGPAAAMLFFMESSNVEIVQRTDVSRQVRRAHERHGRQIALTVQVKRDGKRTAYAPSDHPNKANYSHQFEVSGHYKHHWEFKPDGTENKQFARIKEHHPERVIVLGGKECIRLWCPDFTKGPKNAPLIPKTRVFG